MSTFELHDTQHTAAAPLLVDARIHQPCRDCWQYRWDQERGALRPVSLVRAAPDLPADLGIFSLEGSLELPLLLLLPESLPPGTFLQARLLGALRASDRPSDASLPVSGWLFVGTAAEEVFPTAVEQLLTPEQRQALEHYARLHALQAEEPPMLEPSWCNVEEAARLLRETRFALKRARREQGQRRSRPVEEEPAPLTWRTAAQRTGVQLSLHQGDLLRADATLPYAQPERLIRFIPQRFQKALADLLLEDEPILAFVQRPLLRQRTGLLRLQTRSASEGLLVVTAQQVLWLRDFFTPGSSFIAGGYIAHSFPLERLSGCTLLPAGGSSTADSLILEPKASPYPRLVLQIGCADGSEVFPVEFPATEEAQEVLARLHDLLLAFVPMQDGRGERRLRTLPQVEIWQPDAATAERLAGLGGVVSEPVAERLEQRLAKHLAEWQEERLISVLVPPLETYQSPARLVALTRRALLLCEEMRNRARGAIKDKGGSLQRYELRTISSARLCYSVFGSELDLFIPQPEGNMQQQIIPFHSPAIAWFVPLFTRLRTLLRAPDHQEM